MAQKLRLEIKYQALDTWNPVCRIAIIQQLTSNFQSYKFGWGGWIRTNEMPVPKTGALPLGDAPIFYGVDDGT